MMSRRIVDFKPVDMEDEEFEMYKGLVAQFTSGGYSGSEQFRDVFDVDGDGCIRVIRPPLKRQIGWAVLVFLQNLMINQRLRRMEKKLTEFLDERRKDTCGSGNDNPKPDR